MVEEKIIEEIYNVLIERFGVGEIFLPKFGKRKVNISWKEFIKAALELTAEDLYKYCVYASTDSFGKGMKKTYPAIVEDKSGRLWFIYFCDLIVKKRCSNCLSILEHESFYKSSGRKDSYAAQCKFCYETYKQANIEKIAEYQMDYRNSHKEERKIYDIEYYQLNKEKRLENSRKYRRLNKESIVEYRETNKEVIAVQRKVYYYKNKYLFYSYNAKRRAIKLQASPPWAAQEKIKQIYKERPEGYHVDHVIPLQHPLVCGLHCEFNLQYLPARENLSKSNKFDVENQE